MAQYNFVPIVSASENGTQHATRVNAWRLALDSTNSGTSRPAGVQVGQLWWDTSAGSDAYALKVYKGSSADITMLTANFTAGVILSSQVLLDEDDAGAGATKLEVTSALADNFDELRVQFYSVGWGAPSADLQFEASDDGGSSYVTHSNTGQNTVVAATHYLDNPATGGNISLIAKTTHTVGVLDGWISATYDGSANTLVGQWGGGVTAGIVVGAMYDQVTSAKFDAFKLTRSAGTNITGKLRLWGMPQA